MAGDGLRYTGGRIPIPVVLASVANEDTAKSLNGLDQLDSFHETASSSTLRMPEMCPPLMSW